MEIKVGDKVRVREDAPRTYLKGWNAVVDYRVYAIYGEAAIITYGRQEIAILLKYLVKVEDDKNVKIGDKVVVHYPSGDRIGRIREVMLDGTYDIDFGGGCTGHNITRSQIESYTAPKIKVGDFAYHQNTKVKIAEIHDNGDVVAYTYDNYRLIGRECDFEPYTEPTEQTEAEKKPNVGSIKIPVEVDLTDSYWDAYTADLAKEIALKVANKYNDPKEVAEYAVSVAKAVVEELKRK